MYIMNPPDDENNIARNMQRKLINIINKWCIKLEHEIKYDQNAGQQHTKIKRNCS